jgi:hypothetical protein
MVNYTVFTDDLGLKGGDYSCGKWQRFQDITAACTADPKCFGFSVNNKGGDKTPDVPGCLKNAVGHSAAAGLGTYFEKS